jgi:hypothetical protein
VNKVQENRRKRRKEKVKLMRRGLILLWGISITVTPLQFLLD